MLCIMLDTYFGVERHIWAWGIGTGFALAALLVSTALILQTYRYNHYPPLRLYLILVLLMVPVYAIFAWLGLIQKEYSQYWDLLRGVYEAVAIWAFYEFLVIYLGGRQHMSAILETKPRGKHLAPFCCLQGWNMHRHFYIYTRLCVIQYIVTQVVCTIIIFVCSLTGNYTQGHFSLHDAYPYTAMAVNCSQIIALYGLVEFYQQLKQDLAPTHPFYKFLCIKLVVFFTFWQSVFLSMLVAVDVITPTTTYSTDQESYGIDDFIICIEMFFFAIAHWLAFPPREFEKYQPPPSVECVTQEQGAKTGIDLDWMDVEMYKRSEGDRAAGRTKGGEAEMVEVGGPGGATSGEGVGGKDWAYTRTEGGMTADGDTSAGARSEGDVEMAPVSHATPTVHSADAHVQPAELNSGNPVHANVPPLPPRRTVGAGAAGAPSDMEVTDVSYNQ